MSIQINIGDSFIYRGLICKVLGAYSDRSSSDGSTLYLTLWKGGWNIKDLIKYENSLEFKQLVEENPNASCWNISYTDLCSLRRATSPKGQPLD